VRVSLKAVAGVDSVEVNLEKGLASVKMKPGNTATLKQLNDAIAKNGFTMKQSTAAIAGTVVVANGHTALRVSGSNEMLELVPDSSATPVSVSLDGKPVLVEGAIPEAGKGKSPDSIRYSSPKEENSK
jgi:hypothetical protein